MELGQLNTKQLIALWYGGLLGCSVLGVFGFSEGSVVATVSAILFQTVLIAFLLGDHPKANTKRVYRWSFGLPAGLAMLAGLAFGLIHFLGEQGQTGGSDSATFGSSASSTGYPDVGFLRAVSNQIDTAHFSRGADSDYPAELFSMIIYRRPNARSGSSSCIGVRGTLYNHGSEVIEAVGIRVTVQDTLGNLLADPALGETLVTVAPGEKQTFDASVGAPCMMGVNRQYQVSLSNLELRE